ncbi:YdcH family protein [Cognatishimia sp. F0-27]|uniref:YdcH family protein n=1 Tax=Cognatishimia sp. F0-27 TaxID=2816855 RepID=UPI001D0C577C|nr:YdcH family protein [Cognatishimia sp. F0-27]MCC1494093.1 YdcH family protein [Cognatishimia sp. F0-27]
MSHTPHELAEEFPEYVERIHELKQENAHFAKLADEYHRVNRAVHGAETNVTPMGQFSEEDLRKQRAALKDEIWGLLRA